VLNDRTPTGGDLFFRFAKLVALQYAVNQLRDSVVGFSDRDTAANKRSSSSTATRRSPDSHRAYLQMVADWEIQAMNFLRDTLT
jgi:hypothetical protein